jgi:hypothetical protein
MAGRGTQPPPRPQLIRQLLIRVRGCCPIWRILLVTDGLSSYKSQALQVFGNHFIRRLLRGNPGGVDESHSGCWRPRMQPDHSSMWRSP